MPKQYQEVENAIKLENSDCKIPDPSQPHDGTAPPPPGARHVGSGTGLGVRPLPSELPPLREPALPHRGGEWTGTTIPPAGSGCRRCRLRCAPAAGSPAEPSSLRTHGLTGRHRLPAPPPSRAGSAPAPRQDRSERTLRSCTAPNPAGERAGEAVSPVPGSSSPSEPGHAGQPAPCS